MYTRGPIAAEIPTSPGTFESTPVIAKRANPRKSVSPTFALSAMRSEGSTNA